jgi:hypothetical protein
MRFWAVSLVCAATGCAQIFGLDVTTGAPDANLDKASLQIQRVSVGATVQKNPQDMSGQMATFYQDDGAGGLTAVPGELGPAPMDTFTAPLNMGTPPVKFDFPPPNNQNFFFAFPGRAQKGTFVVYEHPNPTAADPAAAIMLSATLPTPYVTGESFQLLAVGAWTNRALGAADLPAPDLGNSTIAPAAAIPYSSFGAMFGATMKNKIIASDYLLLLRYQNNKLTGVMQSQFEQSTGTDPVSGAVTPNNTTATAVNIPIDPTGFSTRYSAVRPAPGAMSMSYSINAAPGWSILNQTGIQLAAGGNAMTDSMLTTSYGNPFESLMWKTVLTFSTSTPRMTPFMHMGMPVSLGAGMYQLQIQDPANTLTLPAPLPITVRIANQALTTDGMSVTIDVTKPIEVKADLDKTTAPTALGVNVDELTSTGARMRVLNALGIGPDSITLPPNTFAAGKTYVIQYVTYQGGYPNAMSGDLQTQALPLSVAYLDSGVFTVAP